MRAKQRLPPGSSHRPMNYSSLRRHGAPCPEEEEAEGGEKEGADFTDVGEMWR